VKTIANDRTWRRLRVAGGSQVADTRLGRQAYGRRGVFTEILNRLHAPAGQANIITTATATQFIEADSWDQQITTGSGTDLVIAGQWELPAGSQDADIVNTGEGSDLVFTGQGRDFINTGGGDDFNAGAGIDLIIGDGLYVTDAQWAVMPLVLLDNLRRSDSGNDELHGGDGNDVLMGQVGDGSFVECAIGSIADFDCLTPGTRQVDSKYRVFEVRKRCWRRRMGHPGARSGRQTTFGSAAQSRQEALRPGARATRRQPEARR